MKGRCFAIVFFIVSFGVQSVSAYAKTLQCDKPQKICTIDDLDLTVGDKVGIFNEDNELVAIGIVKEIKGSRRTIKIVSNMSKIKKNYTLSLLNVPEDKKLSEVYKVYREPSKESAGGSVGIGTLGVGKGAVEFELSGFYQWRRFANLALVARGVIAKASGDIARIDSGIETTTFSMMGFGGAGGVSYSVFEGKPIGFRGEVVGGFMFVSATVGGSAGDVDGAGFNTGMKNGIGLLIRGDFSMLIERESYRIALFLTPSLVHNAVSYGIGAGIIKDL